MRTDVNIQGRKQKLRKASIKDSRVRYEWLVREKKTLDSKRLAGEKVRSRTERFFKMKGVDRVS